MACVNLTNAKTGAQSLMGYQNSSCSPADPYGVALDLTVTPTEAKICCEVTENFSAEELKPSVIGCGGDTGFGTESDLGARDLRVNLAGDLGFHNGFDRILAQFFGAAAVPVAAGVTLWKHVITASADANKHFGTFVYETSKTDILELKNTYAQSISIDMSGVRNYIRWGAELIANEVETSSLTSVNNNADLATLSFIDKELVVPQCIHRFMLKRCLDDGTDTAFSTGTDTVAITSLKLDLNRPLETIEEMTGSVCNAPIQNAQTEGTLTIGLKEHKSNSTASYTNWLAGDKYSAWVTWLGTVVGAGTHTFTIKMPKLALVKSPGYNITDPGLNPYTLEFRLLNSKNVLPDFVGNGIQVEITNRRTVRYLVP